MPRESQGCHMTIRLALRIRGDQSHWRITPKDAAHYERHHKRTEGGATYNFLHNKHGTKNKTLLQQKQYQFHCI